MKYKARLCDIKPLDCESANKFVRVWNKLNSIEKDFNGEGKNPCVQNLSYDDNAEFNDITLMG